MRRTYIAVLAVAAVLAVIVGGVLVSSYMPPSIDLFIEDWGKCPSAFHNLYVIGGKGYFHPHSVRLSASFTPPRSLMVYRYRIDVGFVDRIARVLGLRKEFESNATDLALRTAGYTNRFGNVSMFVRGYFNIEYSVRGVRPTLVGHPPPLIGEREIEVANRWLKNVVGVELNKSRIVRIEVRGYTAEYYLRLGDYVGRYPSIRMVVVKGRVAYANVNLAELFAKPYMSFKPRDLDNAVRILKATLDIGESLRNARGWDPKKDAHLLAAVSDFDFNVVIIGDVKIGYNVVGKDGYAYIVPIYVFSGVTDKGKSFSGDVDAIDRKHPIKTFPYTP